MRRTYLCSTDVLVRRGQRFQHHQEALAIALYAVSREQSICEADFQIYRIVHRFVQLYEDGRRTQREHEE